VGHHAIQVLRTYPQREVRYPFASQGERSIARGFAKAIARARSLIYIEDQYLWSTEIAWILAGALRKQRELQLIAVVPRYPDKDSRVAGPPARLAQTRAIALLQAAGGHRVGIYDLENEDGTPIYVHAKVCVIDDVWALLDLTISIGGPGPTTLRCPARFSTHNSMIRYRSIRQGSVMAAVDSPAIFVYNCGRST
jgi:phosphatidylserine/phosphatidylglycerophosphate/cardiolipin synthase-like enzyme